VKLKIKYNMLKRIIYLLLLSVFPLITLGKDQAHLLFEKGNEQYAKARYKEAIAYYQKILDAKDQSAEVHFNMGNAFYRIGDISSALLYYEKARKLAPGDDDINFNIRLANLKITDKTDNIPEFFLEKWWNALILSFLIRTLSIVSVLCFLLGSLLLVIYLFTQSVTFKKSSFYIAIICFCLGSGSIFISSKQSSYFNSHLQAIIFSSSVTVKSEPVHSSKNLFVIHNGIKVDIMERNKGWLKIKLPNGNTGWIISSDAKEI
jgi:Bacterial SH3 domain/Tetratricopeptide repeat